MAAKPNFEKQLEKLQHIVDKLENGNLTLEESVLIYKEGKTIAKTCQEQLEKARQTVSVRTDDSLEEFIPKEEDKSA